MNTTDTTAVLRTTRKHRKNRKVTLHRSILGAGIAALLLLPARPALAATATWLAAPTNNDWNTAGNWTAGGPPNGSGDTATFNLTTNPALRLPSLSANTEVDGISFLATANAFTITTPATFVLTLSGTGITNSSGITQNFVSDVNGAAVAGVISFLGSATAGTLTNFTNNGGTVSGANGGVTNFSATSTAGSGTFTTNGGTVSGANGGVTNFSNSSKALSATFTTNGGTIAGAVGGITQFRDTAQANTAILIANGGTAGGGGGTIFFLDDAVGNTATVKVYGNGNLDISNHSATAVSIGSVEGTGNVFLGMRSLTVGSNNVSTTFDGAIQNGGSGGGTGGSLTKTGSGTLTLGGTNTYTGATVINAGTLIVNGSLGNTAVTVTSTSTLGGSGVITGGVTINSGGTLSPGSSPGNLVTGSQVWAGGGNYNWQVHDVTGAPGTEWDTTTIIGTLNLSGLTIATPFNINLWSLSSLAPDVNGNATNFNSGQNHAFTLASTTGGIVLPGGGFDPALFNINTAAANGTSGFSNALAGGTWSMFASPNNLLLTFTPAALPAKFWLGGTDGKWTGNVNNWASDAAGTSTTAIPTSTDDITFSATGAANRSTTLEQNFTIHSLTINDTVPVGIASGAGSNTLTISGSAGTGITVGTGANLTISANVTLAGSSDTIAVNGTGLATISGVLGSTTASSALIKTGTGKLTLTGANTYTGATSVNAGTLQLSGGGTINGTSVIVDGTVANNPTLIVDGAGSIWTNSSSLTVGNAGTGTLTIQSGGKVSDTAGIIGTFSGGNGTALVTGAGSTWTNSANLSVGNSGMGLLTIQAGGAVSSSFGTIGTNPGSTGTVLVDGTASTWANSSTLTVGRFGTGLLTILNGGVVSSTSGTVGLIAGVVGTATVDGAGSKWTNSGGLTVGNSGTGTLSILNGGAVSNTTGIIGDQASGNGTVLVTGTGSKWTNSANVFVGLHGTGMMTITAGGAVSNTTADIGDFPASHGTVLVDGTGGGATWTNSGNLTVGAGGTGNLTIQGGGTVSNVIGHIGSLSGSNGAVTVTGAGSTWTSSSEVTVGFFGTGALTIQNGGKASNTDGTIGKIAGGIGTVLVDGAGSTWTNSGFLVVGDSGTGTMTIQNGGAVSSTSGTVGSNAGAVGTVTVDGTGSTWTNSGLMFVGNSGTGTLTIQNGGVVSNTGTGGFVGNNAGAVGTVTVDGTGSTWTNTGSVTVGISGTGLLTIQAGGTISNTIGLIGSGAGSHGTVLVDGTGSTWTNSGTLVVGSVGTGLLMIQNGGKVSNTTGFISLDPSGNGTVLVSGTGSTWTNSGALIIGSSGPGMLTIQAGGTVTNTVGAIGNNSGSNGTVLVDGTGTTWTNSSNLTVGLSGTGLMTIQNGGVVNVGGGAGNVTLANQGGSNGTLDIGNGGGAGTLNAATVNGGAGTAVINFNHTDAAYTFAPKITGTTTVNHNGSGSTILTAANTYTGDTNINAGTLFVDGSIASPNTFVNSGGTLGGGGTLFGHVFNHGVVSPGHSPGTLHIAGNFTQFADGVLRIEVAGTQPGQFDVLAVGGHASLAGTLQIVNAGLTTAKAGDTLAILTAAGGVSGVFSAVINPFASSGLVTLNVIYEANDVLLAFTQNSFAAFAGTLGFTPNQLAVATALDSVTAKVGGKTGAISEFNFLDTQPLSTLKSNLDMMSPEELTSIFHLAKSLANVQTANVERRLDEIRALLEQIVQIHSVNISIGGSQRVGKTTAPVEDERWGLWFTGSGEFTHVGSTTNAAGFNLDSGGVTAGVDYRFTDHFAAGISLGYMNTTASLSNGGKLDVDGGRVGAYATYFDRGFHVDASVSGGVNGYRTRRTTPNNTVATANPGGTEVNLLLATGYDWKLGGLTLGPTASFQYTNTELDGFTESGSFAPLSVIRRNADSMRTALGVKATYDWKVGRRIIRPEVRAAWQHEFADTSYSLTSTFATLGGSAFTVAGPSTGRDSLLVGAGLSIQWNSRFSTYAYYDGELLRTNYSSNNVSVGCRWRF